MDSEGQGDNLLVRLPSGALLFTCEYLQNQIAELNSVTPEQVLCNNPDGIFRDFGNGFYAYLSSPALRYQLSLTCIVGGISFKTTVTLDTAKAIELPEQFIAQTRVPGSFGYSILSDGTVMIPLHVVSQQLLLTQFSGRKVDILSVATIDEGYLCKRTNRYFIVYESTSSGAPKQKEVCHLKITFKVDGEREELSTTMCIELGIFTSIATARPVLTTTVENLNQSTLIAITPVVASPISFVDCVYSLRTCQFLEPQTNGSFIETDGRPVTEHGAYAYMICDGVEYVTLCIAVTTNTQIHTLAQCHATTKWCDIALNKAELQGDFENPLSCVPNYSSFVDVISESTDAIILSTRNTSRGVGKLCLEADQKGDYSKHLAARDRSFELVFMPNVVFRHCIKNKTETHWTISTREITDLVSQRVAKKIRDINVNSDKGAITKKATGTLTVETKAVEPSSYIVLNLTLNFEDGSKGFSSITV